LFWMSVYSYVPNLPKYSESLGADAVVLGIIGGVYGVAQIILRIPIGMISDNTGKNRLIMVIGSVVLVLSCGLLILANDTGMIVLGRLIAGAAAAWWVVQSAVYAEYFNEAQQIKAQGVIGASANWGKLVAALVGGMMAQYFGLHSVFIFAFVVAVACIFLTLQIKDVPKMRESKPVIKSLRELIPMLKSRDMIVFSIIGIITNILCFSAPTYFTAIAAENLGANSMDIGLLNVVFYLIGAATSMLVGTRLYKKVGGIHAMAVSFIICGFSCIPFFYHINVQVIFLMEALAGICFGVTSGAAAGMVLRSVAPDQRGAATGIYQSLYGIGILIGPMLVGGLIKYASFDTSYWALAAIGALSAVFCYAFVPQKYARM
ncbi:MAG: MFS transporter, partial [Eubacteriales bacterium]